MPLTALALNCTLKPSPADSSCELLRMASTPDKVVQTTQVLALNCVHLARLLQQHPYPAQE
ncbi:hypothetical protein [Pseudomonas sp. MYb185]|uniref:hypothetical protein n=1 Tax=Pseudomonas sp. MYb185 TaxID=1848729 RepID=UPI000CFD3066|nr:hypothetical protein [Pseudomonas sp. MYb185]PRB84324.1 hypothetical protein CQ007_00635 [Pseudomonas sp. MYb185]